LRRFNRQRVLLVFFKVQERGDSGGNVPAEAIQFFVYRLLVGFATARCCAFNPVMFEARGR
jgi:hypothetical protein